MANANYMTDVKFGREGAISYKDRDAKEQYGLAITEEYPEKFF